jgi:L-iditol 2-dehydrogenase
MNTMRSMVLTARHRMAMRQYPMPVIRRPDEVLLRINTVGVCGSDVHYYLDGRIGSQVVKYPFAVGHECAGTVVTVGRGVRSLRPGDRVAVEPAVSCGTCDQCQAGRPHTCRKLLFLGCPGQLAGALAEYMVMPARCCVKIPKNMTMDQAALAEPLSIGLYAADLSGAGPGSIIAILGAGPIGLCTMLAAQARGVKKIYVTDRRTYRCTAASHAGASWTGNPDRTDIVKSIGRREPHLLDAVFECCGQQAAIDQAVDLLKPGGILVLVGIPAVDRISLNIDQARRKELVVQNVRRQNHCFEPAIAKLASGRIDADFMITHHFDLAHSQSAFNLVADYRNGVLKAMIEID